MPEDATAHLIFASDQANHNFAHVLGDLRRAHLSVGHRLRSIHRDAEFVAAVAARFEAFPLVANERCGRWYIPVHDDDGRRGTSPAASAYFKSTDGHTGQWAFSTRRLNLHLLPLMAAGGGCVLVDSTRSGKRMSDALSKTVPLWCCVVNRALFGGEDEDGNGSGSGSGGGSGGGPNPADYTALHTPPGVVSPSEHSQMLARVPAAVASLRRLGVLVPDPAAWRRRHLPGGKPLRPVWVTPDTPLSDLDLARGPLADRFTLVVCCTASSAASAAAAATAGPDYVQGAADDAENWALGLTPDLFWAHHAALLATPEADLPARIHALVRHEQEQQLQSQQQKQSSRGDGAADAAAAGAGMQFMETAGTAVNAYLSVGQWSGRLPPAPTPTTGDDGICRIVFVREAPPAPTAGGGSPWVCVAAAAPPRLEVRLGKQDKTAGRALRHALPAICAFAADYLAADGKAVRVLCPTGRDLSVGAALALLCVCFDEAGTPLRNAHAAKTPTATNKDAIRRRLARIMTAMPHANPSRTTLQSVNSFLMDAHR